MNSGLNGIISEFWSTANSGCFTNCPSLPCGGQSRARGRNGCRRLATFHGGGGAPPRGCPRACGQLPPMSARGSGLGRGLGRGGWGQAPGREGWTGWGERPDWGSTRGSIPAAAGPRPGPQASPLPPGPWRRDCKACPPAQPSGVLSTLEDGLGDAPVKGLLRRRGRARGLPAAVGAVVTQCQ